MAQAVKAIDQLNDLDVKGRRIAVRMAHPKGSAPQPAPKMTMPAEIPDPADASSSDVEMDISDSSSENSDSPDDDKQASNGSQAGAADTVQTAALPPSGAATMPIDIERTPSTEESEDDEMDLDSDSDSDSDAESESNSMESADKNETSRSPGKAEHAGRNVTNESGPEMQLESSGQTAADVSVRIIPSL